MENDTVIGNTPMIKITYKYKGKQNNMYAKLEMFNLTGSIKDRVAYYIIKNAKEKGILRENMPIIEATSGNTGISLSALGAYYKHPVYIFMPDWASKERIELMKLYGANITLIAKEEGGFIKCVEEAKNLAKKLNGFLANQFENEDNILAHYETTGKEILEQLEGKKIGGFVSGVGTGGTLMGIGKRLKENDNKIKIYALEPEKMPILSNFMMTGKQVEETRQPEKMSILPNDKILGQHKIEGIGDDFIPDIFKRNAGIIEKDIFLINDEDAVNMARKLAKQLGLGVGISSGANLIGAVLAQEKLEKNMEGKSKGNAKGSLEENKEGNIVTVFADDNKKYLSTDLGKKIVKDVRFISNQVELLDYEIVLKGNEKFN